MVFAGVTTTVFVLPFTFFFCVTAALYFSFRPAGRPSAVTLYGVPSVGTSNPSSASVSLKYTPASMTYALGFAHSIGRPCHVPAAMSASQFFAFLVTTVFMVAGVPSYIIVPTVGLSPRNFAPLNLVQFRNT